MYIGQYNEENRKEILSLLENIIIKIDKGE